MDFLVSPMVNILLWFYSLLGSNFVLGIVVMTILVRMITLPLTLPQQRSTRKMQALQPQLEALKKKYGNDRNKLAEAQMKLYKENNVSMFGGCLPLIVQLFIMIAFYEAIIGALAVNPIQLLSLSHRAAPELASLIPINSQFLWFDLGRPDATPGLMFILPGLVVITTYLQQKMATPPTVDSSASSMTRQMNIMMPLMFGLFALQFASGLSIYFIVSNLVGMVQYYFIGRNPSMGTASAKQPPAKQPPAKQVTAKAKK